MYHVKNSKTPFKFVFVFTLFFLVFTLFFLPSISLGGQYTPEGLYDPKYFTLDNGLDVVLKKRDVTHNVAIRLAGNVGKVDFPCGQKELPHFLEHLLFTGTSKHSETELEALIEGRGGSWNASTDYERTTYEIDIYSPNALFALDMLYEIITDSIISEENVEITRDIIHRESNGKPSVVRKWLYRHGIGRDAFTNAFLKIFSGNNIFCPTLQTAEGLTRNDIMNVYNKFYVPNNMVMVVVGEFNRNTIIDKIQKTFGSLKQKHLQRERGAVPPYHNNGPSEITGLFSPIVDSDALVGLAFRTNGYLSSDIHPLTVIEYYLDTQLYNSLRIENGLSYSPASEQWDLDTYGILYLYADVNIDDIDIALDELRIEVKELKDGTFNPDDIKQAKQKILLSWVQGFESNADIADYYVSKHHEFTKYGSLIDHEEKIEHVMIDDVRDVASKYFAEGNSAIIKRRPQFSYTQFYTLTAMVLFMAAFVVWRLIRRIRRGKCIMYKFF
jgi:predicted Zn-dependent peptidase